MTAYQRNGNEANTTFIDTTLRPLASDLWVYILNNSSLSTIIIRVQQEFKAERRMMRKGENYQAGIDARQGYKYILLDFVYNFPAKM